MKGKFATISEISQLVELAAFHYKAYCSKIKCSYINDSYPDDFIAGEPGVHDKPTAANYLRQTIRLTTRNETRNCKKSKAASYHRPNKVSGREKYRLHLLMMFYPSKFQESQPIFEV